MEWVLIGSNPSFAYKLKTFPVTVGRSNGASTPNFISVPSEAVAGRQFTLQPNGNGLLYANVSPTPALVNGRALDKAVLRENGTVVIRVGQCLMGLGTDYAAVANALEAERMTVYYYAKVDGQTLGPMTEAQLVNACNSGQIDRDTVMWDTESGGATYAAGDKIDFGPEPEPEMPSQALSAPVAPPPSGARRTVLSDESEVIPGENFKCPYCRAVSNLEDVLSVSVSPALLGDTVLGAGEQVRFLPSQFTASGLALDSYGGVCTEIACPHCHMSLPQNLLDLPQNVMAVIGAAGAGKSVFLASSIWQCRQLLSQLFGLTFMDLDPVANRWINAYEEKLFFQEDDTSLQQIEKTDLQATNVTRTVFMDGEDVLIPLPSFFQINRQGGAPESLVVYDSAGEHFRAGADSAATNVTLNMLSADVLFFMYDPSADPRFRALLNAGSGTAKNYAQRQDTLLAEMSARIKRHLGNRGETKLSRPLIFGVSKADMLRDHIPLDLPVYKPQKNGMHALDVGVLSKLSEKTEAFLNRVVPEVVVTAHNVAEKVWFLPISSLGHNPMREGVRPCDIKPVWTELPVVVTLARKGFIKTVNGKI